MFRNFLSILLLVTVSSRSYVYYNQCNDAWKNVKVGHSGHTICQNGASLTCLAMAQTGVDRKFNPATLNTWLLQNGGYIYADLIVLNAFKSIGLNYEGKVSNNEIKSNLDSDKIVIINVHNGSHWALATGYQGNSIIVLDPGYSTTSYNLQNIVDQQTIVYSPI